MGKAEATVEQLVGRTEREELRLPENQRRCASRFLVERRKAVAEHLNGFGTVGT